MRENERVYGYTLITIGLISEQVVYVGSTNDPAKREEEHKRDGKDFNYLSVETGPMSRREAERWEEATIKRFAAQTGYRPYYNRTMNGRRRGGGKKAQRMPYGGRIW